MSSEKIQNKDKITDAVRAVVWETYNGECYKAKCFCCRTNMLTVFDFDCGYIISEKHGGKATVQNLRPICGTCTESIGTENMMTFIRRNGFHV